MAKKVDIASVLQKAKEGTSLYQADAVRSPDMEGTTERFDRKRSPTEECFSIDVTPETTVQAGLRLSQEVQLESGDSLCLLNFASAKNPGGGFEGGSMAQEESLACSSGLYACLIPHMNDFYEPHRKDPKDGFYSHAMLYSPEVPFFRDDDSAFCPVWTAGVITAPAPNAGVVMRKHSEEELIAALTERIRRILNIATEQGHTHLILGAYGCGVFRNDPEHVAMAFDYLLQGDEAIGLGVFKKVIFAIPDGKDGNLEVFKESLGRGKMAHSKKTKKASRSETRTTDSLKKRGKGAGGRWRRDAHHQKYADEND